MSLRCCIAEKEKKSAVLSNNERWKFKNKIKINITEMKRKKWPETVFFFVPIGSLDHFWVQMLSFFFLMEDHYRGTFLSRRIFLLFFGCCWTCCFNFSFKLKNAAAILVEKTFHFFPSLVYYFSNFWPCGFFLLTCYYHMRVQFHSAMIANDLWCTIGSNNW